MYFLFIGLGLAAFFFLVVLVFAIMQRSKGDTIIHPEDEGEMDYDGLEDKEFLCRNCGDVVDAFDEECNNCGAELDPEFECQYCGEFIDDPRELVCPSCGEALLSEVTVCPACNSVCPNSATHCEVCNSDFWSPIYLSPRKVPRFVPPEEPEEGEEEEGEGGGEEGEESYEEDY